MQQTGGTFYAFAVESLAGDGGMRSERIFVIRQRDRRAIYHDIQNMFRMTNQDAWIQG